MRWLDAFSVSLTCLLFFNLISCNSLFIFLYWVFWLYINNIIFFFFCLRKGNVSKWINISLPPRQWSNTYDMEKSIIFIKLKIASGKCQYHIKNIKINWRHWKSMHHTPYGTKLVINAALYSSKSRRNLISFKTICQNGYHMKTKTINEKKFLCLTTESNGTKIMLERMPVYSSGLYLTCIHPIEINVIRLDNKELFHSMAWPLRSSWHWDDA